MAQNTQSYGWHNRSSHPLQSPSIGADQQLYSPPPTLPPAGFAFCSTIYLPFPFGEPSSASRSWICFTSTIHAPAVKLHAEPKSLTSATSEPIARQSSSAHCRARRIVIFVSRIRSCILRRGPPSTSYQLSAKAAMLGPWMQWS
ncbi:hypothetical protein IFM58399_05543 [Aspergillus lentulus]|uniref:uncharacterized protein n=1 Tax=Aspergillus lentulus TaxID=293939 RepID=UPI0013956C9A|nr:uncharacterized protein IFM58399_05543 [Aspergillus lentulus]GFF39325.1 hypothetical protein IFM58399_05543 [Aspergillus lentulus]GFG08962.1 hypothetical protein IFM61392_05639 [Aspergillus lentulus]